MIIRIEKALARHFRHFKYIIYNHRSAWDMGKHRSAEYNKGNCDFHLYFIFAQEYSKMCSFTADRIFCLFILYRR